MSNYRRVLLPGASYFFTVVTHQRQPLFNNKDNVELLRGSFSYVLTRRPFQLNAIVVMPDHLHCIWTMPEYDANYASRWQILKSCFTRKLNRKPVWQPRYWEHCLRDEDDWRRHLDYIHFNPVKHGLAASPGEWEFSSFRRFVAAGFYDDGWGSDEPASVQGLALE